MSDPYLLISHLSKAYSRGTYAIHDVNLELSRGVFGLLGPNGAGKTTLLRLLATILKPSSGCVSLNGLDSASARKKYRSQIGYLPQSFGLYSNLSALEHLLLFSTLSGTKNSLAKEAALPLLNEVGLSEYANRPISEFSGGMKQRLGIAIALVGKPRLLLFDEPTAGLDPQERIRFRSLIEKVSRTSIVFLSTHIVQDVELGCSRVAVMQEGRILRESSPEKLISSASESTWVIDTSFQHCDEIKRSRSVTAIRELSEDCVRVRFVGKSIGQGERKSHPTLEDAYVNLLCLDKWESIQ